MGKKQKNNLRTDRLGKKMKTFYIISEGKILERKYFDNLKNRHVSDNYAIAMIKSKMDNAGAPLQLLRRLKNYIKKNSENLNPIDEIWVITDRDNWELDQLEQLQQFCKDNNCCFAISDPKFEFWILLHYEDGRQLTSVECSNRLGKYYTKKNINLKTIDINFNIKEIQRAIKRAKTIDTLSEDKGYGNLKPISHTTIYKLVQNILDIP
jgi:hypothetical protein